VVRRRHPDGAAYLFVINHRAADVDVPGTGTGEVHDGRVRVPGRGVAVLRQATAGARPASTRPGAGKEGAR